MFKLKDVFSLEAQGQKGAWSWKNPIYIYLCVCVCANIKKPNTRIQLTDKTFNI